MTTTQPMTRRFESLPPDAPARELEERVLAQWDSEGLFARIDEARRDAPEWVFFEGPPTANGRPGIHHVLARTIKDLFCRHRVMRGFHVVRKAGWDTHGLPVEIEVEKALGISGKQQIEELGVERFNLLCRESVWRYKDDWEQMSARIGYALDYSDPYITYSNDYIESVWWALRTLHDAGLLYRGHKILPYCPRCGTALSDHEVKQGYEDVRDPSVYVTLELRDESSASRVQPPATGHPPASRRILVWTTTPWTLVSNTALAVHPDLTYVEVRRRRQDEPSLILAEERAAAVLGEDFSDRWDVVRRMPGSELAGMRYRRPLDWVPYGEGEHELIVAERFVSAADGSGVVHLSPAFGADDYAAGRRHGLAFLQPVDARGEFPADVPVVGGRFVKDADPLIIRELEALGVLWKAETVEHSYPHCWRCGTPLLYYARESWFVRTTAFRDQMLARNARVDWHPPEMGEGRFGEWLTNNIDWALSRDRYWGTPLPVWVCERDPSHVDAIGRYAELAERLGQPLPPDFDPHKPYIDRYTWECARCAGGHPPTADGWARGAPPEAQGTHAAVRDSDPNTADRTDSSRPPAQGAPAASRAPMMRRVPEVIDAWFDSGSMPFAQWHYPFENREQVERLYPADFIAEGVDQTRGWFYSLLAIATGLGEALPNNGGMSGAAFNAIAAPYKAVVVNDQILDANGVKMSKRLGNIVNPMDVVARHGADAVRIFLIASSQVWLPRRFDETLIREQAGQFLLTLKNTYTGIFAQYANFGWEPSAQDPAPGHRPPIDRWVLSRLASVAHDADELLGRFEATLALRLVMDFVVGDVSNWYVRLCRSRFYDVESDDNRAAFATLHEVLVCAARLLAPFAPFVSDWMHRALTGGSVHVAPYAYAGDGRRDAALERGMTHVRTLATLARAAREEVRIKTRQPLSRLVCVVPDGQSDAVTPLVPLLATELNVKRVEFAASGAAFVRLEAKANFRSLGKRFGKRTPLAARAVAALSEDALMAFERGEEVAISVEGESHALLPEDVTVLRRATGAWVVKEDGGYVAALDPAVTSELRREGVARELVSRIQRMRKDAGFAVSDRVVLRVAGDAEVEQVVREYRDYISTEVLAVEVVIGGDVAGTPNAMQTVDLDGVAAEIALWRVDQA